MNKNNLREEIKLLSDWIRGDLRPEFIEAEIEHLVNRAVEGEKAEAEHQKELEFERFLLQYAMLPNCMVNAQTLVREFRAKVRK